ncbi:hypothetical protein ASD48_20455 [Streptomyces sp. Root1310]|nr:hypothetical protein ASD48_20455 [Streptomyces sp. Root1310]
MNAIGRHLRSAARGTLLAPRERQPPLTPHRRLSIPPEREEGRPVIGIACGVPRAGFGRTCCRGQAEAGVRNTLAFAIAEFAAADQVLLVGIERFFEAPHLPQG